MLLRYSNVWVAKLTRVGFMISFEHLSILLTLKILMGMLRHAGSVFDWSFVVVNKMMTVQTGPPPSPLIYWRTFIPFFEVLFDGIFNHLNLWVFVAGFMQTYVMADMAQVSKNYPTTRRESALAVVGARSSLASFLIIGVSSACLCHCYMTSLGLGSVDVDPKAAEFQECPSIAGPSAICWNSQYIAIIACGALFAICVFFLQCRQMKFVMVFPAIDAPITHRYRGCMHVAWTDCWKYLAYYISIDATVLAIKSFMFVISAIYQRNYSFGIFYNGPFFINLVFWPCLIVFSTKLCWRYVEVTLTEILRLPVESKHPDSKSIVTLGDAMKSDELPMKYLGFYEFNLMVCTPRTADDIKQFFHLSHPGRHPRNWMGVLDATLKECSEMTKSLNSYVKIRQRGDSVPYKAPLYSASLAQPSENDQANFRKRTLAQAHMRDLTAPMLPPVLQHPPPINRLLFAPQMLKTVFQRMVNHVYQSQIRPQITKAKTFANEKDSQLELVNTLSQAQLIIWGLNSIVEIASQSFIHDNHGILQRDMQKIISVLLNLYDALIDVVQFSAKANPLPPQNSKISYPLQRQLITNVSFNLCRLHRCFYIYYDILGIPENHEKKLIELVNSKGGSQVASLLRTN